MTIKNMRYEDLLSLPYEDGGRFGVTKGIDCYGLVIEMCKRNGKPMKDFAYPTARVTPGEAAEYYSEINAERIGEADARAGDVVECLFDGHLHVAFLLGHDAAIHATYSGVRVSPVTVLRERKYWRIR